ncbi:MAG: MmgE/PrpD family protein [Candidatus Lambdaproteobacteria bacterium]|nr:MmgE/PrpD family protein [Candidatus Lambdaproteobacteria bacterium]
MSTTFTARALELICGTPPQPLAALPAVRTAFEDTLAVTYAGWHEEVTRRVASACRDGASFRPDGPLVTEPENAALMLGTGAHALDYDDVNLDSSGHPSAVLVAALLAAVKERPETAGRLASAFAVALAFNTGLGQVLGFGHYEKGWHATSTVGPLAGAAAVAHLYGLDPSHTRNALGIAAAQAGGLQRNFGSMSKPLQAGLAAAAGLRAARLARLGVTANDDIFAAKGFFDLYRGEQGGVDPEQVTFNLERRVLSVKLYPCCYQTHRPIAAALEARAQMVAAGASPERIAKVELTGPYGSFIALRHSNPTLGSEGKFSAEHTVATALLDGKVGLEHFEPPAMTRPDIAALRRKVSKQEEPKAPGGKGVLESGVVRLLVVDESGRVMARSECELFPGSPKSPPTPPQLEAKVRDCLAAFNREAGRSMSYEQFQDFVGGLFGPARALTAAVARPAVN